MDAEQWLKVNRSLLGKTALLGLGAVWTLAKAGSPGTEAVWTVTSGIISSLGANEIEALLDRFRNHGEVLRNEDLAKAAGRTVGKTLEERIIPQFLDLRAGLQGLADGVEVYWLERVQGINVFETLQEEQLYHLFSQAPGGFSNYPVLTADEWQELSEDLVDWGYGRGILPAEAAEYQDVVAALAGELAANFGQYLRQVLKDDPKAFGGMVLDLHGATLAQLQEIQQYLPKLAQREDVERVLSSLDENFLRLMRQGERMEGKMDRLAGGEGATAALRSQLFNVPSLPLKFLPRSEEVEAIKTKLLGTESQTLVMTGVAQRVGVQGMGGIGKSVLAAAVARDEAVGERFPDGVLWVTLGQKPNVKARLVDCVAYFTGERIYFEDVPQGKAALAQQLEGRACLLVLDDVWQMSHAAAFDGLGPRCQLLVTTRDGRLVTGLAAQGHEVGVLSEEQGLGLVAQWAGEHREGLPPEAVEVVRECGYLPLAVAIAGAMVRGNGANRWRNVLEKLRSPDLARIAYEFPNYPHPNLLKVLQVSVDALPSDMATRYLDLAIFPEDRPIPEGVLEIFWGAIGLDASAVSDVVNDLVAKSLLLRDELDRLSLHDLQVDYVRQQAGDLTARQEQFFAAYGQRYPEGYHEATADEYFARYAIRHHLQVCPHHIPPLLLDFPWLQGKIERLGVGAVLADFEAVPEAVASRTLELVGEAVRLSAHVVQQDTSQLAGQLWGRLLSFGEMTPPKPPYRYFWERIPGIGQHLPKYAEETPQRETFPAIIQLLTQAQQCQRKPWIRPLFPNLTAPGGPLIRTLTGHGNSVNAVAISRDGQRVVSGSLDKTLKVWNLATGEEERTLTGHGNSVTAVAISPDGQRVVSGSEDNTLKV
ncbi:NB-ARC domain-containing protein, partial [Laspinema olomoucense]|uniref:NB-ARC domain-containing protein n=1 Tax=Laspinema olomoucense TaxID=3231600 RepID=UPI0021BB336D